MFDHWCLLLRKHGRDLGPWVTDCIDRDVLDVIIVKVSWGVERVVVVWPTALLLWYGYWVSVRVYFPRVSVSWSRGPLPWPLSCLLSFDVQCLLYYEIVYSFLDIILLTCRDELLPPSLLLDLDHLLGILSKLYVPSLLLDCEYILLIDLGHIHELFPRLGAHVSELAFSYLKGALSSPVLSWRSCPDQLGVKEGVSAFNLAKVRDAPVVSPIYLTIELLNEANSWSWGHRLVSYMPCVANQSRWDVFSRNLLICFCR